MIAEWDITRLPDGVCLISQGFRKDAAPRGRGPHAPWPHAPPGGVANGASGRVDVVTAVHGAYARYLPPAWASLRAQRHQDWTWLVQVDGFAAEVLQALVDCGATRDPRVRVEANGSREGPAVTRNVALGRGAAPLVQNLDADDELEPDALAVLSEACQVRPEVGFAVGHARDLLRGGVLRPRPLPVRPGVLPRGSLLAAWDTGPGGYRLPVHPAGAMWRRSLVLAVGGWLALTGMEDTGLLMAASAVAPGVLVDAPTLRYRRHPAQRSGQRSEFAGGYQIALIRQRAAHLAAVTGWQGLPPANR